MVSKVEWLEFRYNNHPQTAPSSAPDDPLKLEKPGMDDVLFHIDESKLEEVA